MVDIQYFGHSFFKLSCPSSVVLFDPIFDSTKTDLKRNCSIPIKSSDLKNISVILITNETPEHFDAKAVQEIALKNNAVVVAHDALLNKLTLPRHLKSSLAQNNIVNLRGVKIKSVSAHYPKSFFPTGYVLDFDGKRVYHSGVTSLFESFPEKNINLALLPIGGKITMDITDAVRATKIIKPDFVVPMQYNTFDQLKADPRDFKERILKSILRTKPLILTPGQKARI